MGLFGGSNGRQRGSVTPSLMALLGVLAVAGYQNRDKLGEMLNQATQRTGAGGAPGQGGGLSDLLGGLGNNLGGLLGGGTAAGGLAGGLGGLIDSFRNSGQEETARSWVEHGPNRSVSSDELESALGSESIDKLAAQTGLSRDELLNRLSSVLPQAVDRMTPQGRLPTEDETAHWL
jgi:uncharacterized protein YidB (DUF937 family)